MRIIDLTGQRFGKLTVVRFERVRREQKEYLCQCDCGNTRLVLSFQLRRGQTACCGCNSSARRKAQITTHGMTHSPEYRAWAQAKARCSDLNHQAYHWYGGRGITIAAEWSTSFETFLADMGPRPSPKHTLDRISPDGPYSKGNCRWADWRTQQNNRRNNRRVTFNGQTHTIAEWCRRLNLPNGAVYQRFGHGWTVEQAFTTPHRPRASARR